MSNSPLVLTRRRFLQGTAAALGGALSAPILGACQVAPTPPTGGSVKIGVLAPISGPLAPYGDHLKKGVEVGVEIINGKGGIGGRQIQYILEDDKTDPPTAAERARKLLRQDNVDFLMGTISSATTLAVIPEVEQAKKPYLWVIEGEDKNCTKDGKTRNYIFGHGETPEQKMQPFVPYMVKNLGKRVYFIGSDYVFPHFVNEITAKILRDNGGAAVGEDYAPLGTSDFSSYIPKIDAAKPDVLFVSVVGEDGVNLVKQAAQFGLKGKMKFTGIPAFDPTVFSGIADVADGVYTVDRYWEGLDNPINKEFIQAYTAKFKPEWPISGTAAMSGYGTLLIIKAAIEKAGNTNADDVVKALEGLKIQTPAGEVEVDASNHITKLPMRLLQVQGKKYGLVQDLGLIAHPGHSGCSSGDI